MDKLLTTILKEYFQIIPKSTAIVKRDAAFPRPDGIIQVAIGMRRAGKTYILFDAINKLLETGVPKEQILFIDFEDDRLLPMSMKEMGELLDSFYTIYPENHTRKCHIFLDEVQNIDGWHLVLRRYLRSKNVEITITGSSAKLLSKEIHTSLRGRSLAVEVMPYSFNEFRALHNLPIPEAPFSRQDYDIANKQMLSFFTRGGFPEVQHLNDYGWRETLQSYIDTTLLRDVIERHKISNASLLKYLAKTLIINAATIFSVNKFYNDAKSQGYKISKETIYTYLDYLENAFLIFRVRIYSESIRVQQTSSSKIYLIDNGLIHARAVRIKDIYNKYLENQVHLDLRKQGKDVFYYKTAKGYEVDFVTVDKNEECELIQVTWDMDDPKTAEREQRALAQAEQELGIKGRIITHKEYALGML